MTAPSVEINFKTKQNSTLQEERVNLLTTDGFSLEGYLTLPPSEIKGIALLLSGSGPVGEDGDVSGPFVGVGFRGKPTKLNRQLRDCLMGEGIATLRYAKRPPESQSILNLVADAKIALVTLKKRFPTLPVSLVGFSEGATVALLLAEQMCVNAIYLISPPFRDIDSCLEYQFIGWGTRLLRKLDPDKDDFIHKADFFENDLPSLPCIGISTSDLPFDSEERISIQKDLLPLYQGFFEQARPLLEAPQLKAWYHSLKELGDLRDTLKRLTCQIFFYLGKEDAQINPQWLIEDHESGRVRGELRIFSELGHALAPHEGTIGEKKTSGPFDSSFLSQLAQDFRPSLNQ